MAVKNFNDGEKQKLIQIISQGSQVLGEVDDLKTGLRDTVKSLAEELELKPALINKAISIAHKGSYQNLSDDMDTLVQKDELLMTQYKEFESVIDDCIANHDDRTNKELSKYILRFELNVEEMLDKDITMDDINFALKTEN